MSRRQKKGDLSFVKATCNSYNDHLEVLLVTLPGKVYPYLETNCKWIKIFPMHVHSCVELFVRQPFVYVLPFAFQRLWDNETEIQHQQYDPGSVLVLH